MKRIAVVATEKEYADFLTKNVEKYLHKYASFKSYSLEEAEAFDSFTEDFVLISAFSILKEVRPKIQDNSEIIVLSVALSKKQMEMLKDIPSGSRALLVNFDMRSCMHTITSMYDAGRTDIELVPYCGMGDYDRTIDIAITPNEESYVPMEIKKVYNVGESSVDMNTLYKIADKLGAYESFARNEAQEARKEYYYINSSMEKILDDRAGTNQKLNTLLKLMNDGIMLVDSSGTIYLSNEKAQKLLAERSRVLQGFGVTEILPEVDINSTKDKVVKTSTSNLIVSSVEIRSSDEVIGHILTIADFEEEEEKQHSFRVKISGIKHNAKYHFEDIVGNSHIISKAKEEARIIADSDAAIMITGESGTGKELFSQSIHNASTRKKFNFVAVNCAAIPENLLESEMFGYEDGSFTGAKKGGKMGLFELAHKGTIFFDEIAEMPLQLQSKLLRVLEEKKVLRVGGNKTIDIDVRVISATNKNLFEMVEKGEFREDLYYRLNVLPLRLPALRDRREDILPLLESFFTKMNANISLSEEAKKILYNYTWRGNVRELRNVSEYIVSKKKSYIDTDDLPPLKYSMKPKKDESAFKDGSNIIDKFILNEGRDLELYYWVLKILSESFDKGERYGRQTLMEKIRDCDVNYTEGEVRKALLKLSTYGFARSAKGRGGSSITHEGINLLRVIVSFYDRGILV